MGASRGVNTGARTRIDPRHVVIVMHVAGNFMSALDITIVNVALPSIGRSLGATSSSIEWVVVGYLLSLAMWIPASGWFGDRFGTKRVYLTAMAIFTLASAMCAASQSLNQLIAARILQGVGGGMLTPVSSAMLYRAYPPEERARIARIIIVPTIVAPASGPILGGLFADHLTWRWVFFVNVPIGIVMVLFGMFFLREHREAAAGKFDAAGFVLSGSGLALLLYALGKGPRSGWGSTIVLTTAAFGLAALIALVFVELRHSRPMLPLRMLRDRLFRAVNIVSFFTFAAFFGFLFIVPQFLQDARGETPLHSGLTIFPEALGVLVSSQLMSRLYPRVGPRRLMSAGLFSVATTMFLCSFISIDTSSSLIRLLVFAVGFSVGPCMVCVQAAAFATIVPADTGRATAIFNAQRQVAAAVGVALMATVLAARLPEGSVEGAATLGAFRTVFRVAALVALVGGFAALIIRDADAAASMRPRAKPAKAAKAAKRPVPV
jgi:EmrB/QacA subfamily drug resistance transporter